MTLQSELEDLGRLLAQNLTTKGVTSSYTEGLTTLANKILTVPSGGGSCDWLEFKSLTYEFVVSGSISLFAQSNYEPLQNATITLTGSDNSIYTATTDSNGVAIFIVNGVGGNTINYTATYNSTSVTCTVTYKTPLFYDTCDSASGLSNYGTSIQSYKTGGSSTITYNSTENAYQITGSGGMHTLIPINPLTDEDDYKISFQAKHMTGSAYSQPSLYVYDKTITSLPTCYGMRFRGDKIINAQKFGDNVDTNSYSKTITDTLATDYFTITFTKSGTHLSFKVENPNGDKIYHEVYNSESLNANACAFGMWTERGISYGYYVKNITVERLETIYAPTLDGTEQITSINSYTPTISDNQLVTGCGYLTNGWDNTVDWDLTFEYYVSGDNNGYLVIPQGTTTRDYNGVQQWYSNQLNFRVKGASPSGNITNATSTNTWISVRVSKIGYVWIIHYNNTYKTRWDSSSYSSTVDDWNIMCVGLDRDNSRNSAQIRNIKVRRI